MEKPEFKSWSDALSHQASQQPEKRAFTFLSENGEGIETLTFKELHNAACILGEHISKICNPGERVLLLYPPGLDYVVAFYACVYAGVVSIPLYSPQNKRKVELIETIAKDCDAKLALTTEKYKEKIKDGHYSVPFNKNIDWISSNSIGTDKATSWEPVERKSDDLLYLQYTSGSTSDPKGVMLDHACTLYHSEELATLWKTSIDSVLVSWLPHFHDLGQVFSILQPVYKGFSSILLSPAAFMKKPYTWLKAMSDYRATHTAAPDFAYAMCAEQITSDQIKTLDLTHLETAVNGAEPVRLQTINAFYEAFSICGFNANAHCPSYGLAETTLVVSANTNLSYAQSLSLDARSLSKGVIKVSNTSGHIRTLVSNGHSCLETQLEIVDPTTRQKLPDNHIGEIWVSGPGVGLGYWGKDEVTQEIFHALILGGNKDQTFLRTGDLGFKSNGELFITGRNKDLIVIRGSNHYPQDIELSVERCHPILRNGYCAAFSTLEEGEERVVVVIERERYFPNAVDFKKVIEDIRSAVSREHDLSLYQVLIVKPGSISKTTSGKIQRGKCKSEWINNELKIVEKSNRFAFTSEKKKDDKRKIMSLGSAFEIAFKKTLSEWVCEWVKGVNSSSQEIDCSKSFAFYGLNSMDTFKFHDALENFLGKDVKEEIIWESNSIEELINNVISLSKNKEESMLS